MFFKKQKFILFAIAFLALFAFTASVSAQTYGLEYSSILELGTRGLKSMVFTAINVILGFLGVLAITLILYGGFLWMTSGGNPEKINKAKRVLISAVIGMALIIFSFAIAQFIMKSLIDATGGGGGMAGSPCDCGLELGNCAAGGCLRCQNTVDPLVCTWQHDAALTCPGCPGTTNFTAQSFSPPIGHPDPTIRNAVVRVLFNQNVGGTVDDISFVLHNDDLGVDVIGTRVVSGKRIEFIPNTPCPAPHGAWNCFDANTNFTIMVDSLAGAGILRLGDNMQLTCNAFTPCTASFTVGDIIDTQNPTSLNLNLAGNLCIGFPNNLTSSADDDSGISIFEFSDNHLPPFSFTDNAPVCDGLVPNNCIGNAIWTPTAIGGYLPNNNYTLTVQATDLDSNNISVNKNVILRAAHCCNNQFDDVGDLDLLGGPPEEGIDCGGECAACAGAACDTDLGDLGCNCDDNECASGICDCMNFGMSSAECEAAGYPIGTTQCCLCQDGPIIDCVTPNDTSSCSPHGIPVGTVGNLISIWGRNFGAFGPGSQVTINGIAAPLANTVNPQCANVWTNTQIIVVVPSGAVNGVIEVTADNSYSDATNDARGLIIPDFFDDGIVRPGLCKVENIEVGSACIGSDCGFFEEMVLGHGLNILVGSIVEFGNDSSNTVALDPLPNPDFEIDCRVPNIQLGNVGFRVVSATGDYGNYLNFTITDTLTGPRIDYLEPNYGPEGQYVTIYGSGFTNSHTGNAVTFNGTPGNFNFPPECEVSYWQSNRIIVKVPGGASAGDVVVTVGAQDSNGEFFDVCVVGPGCELLPGMCRIAPVSGPVNTLVDIHGEHFGAAVGNVEFYDGNPLFPNTPATSIGGWLETSINNAQVPDAQSGPVYVLDGGANRSSNSIPFEIGDCEGDDANCPNPATQVCCPDGACWPGTSCPVPNFSTYTWSFTTGDYFVREECDTTKPCCDGTDPCDPIVPSPTPWINRDGGGDVCINAAIGASFSKTVNQATVDSTTVLAQECTDATCTVLGVAIPGIFIYHNTALGEIEAFEFQPNALLSQDSWYQITLLGGVGNMATAVGDPLIDDYIWHFKTRNNEERCEIGSVAVNPNPAKLVMFGATQAFTATANSKDNPCLIINTNPAIGVSTNWASDDPLIATVSGSITANEIATAVGNGKVYIKATVMPDNKTGRALLEVDFQGLSIVDYWYDCDSVCINAEMGLRFDAEVNPASLTIGTGNNINIYQCSDSKCLIDAADTPINLTNPITAYLWNNITGDSLTTFSAVGNFTQNSYYRAIIKTGETGVESVLGDHLISLNSNLAFGEECDGEALCDGITCLWTGNVCGTSHQECSPANSAGCSANCLNIGSVANTCNSGVVDAPYENCDDGNNENGDGCSSKCLYEGSTGTAVCGNNIIEFGEACDDGNQTLSDGCNDECLREGANFGQEKTTVLGLVYECGSNGLQQDANGAGEDCDDGNNINGDGCSSQCLSEGVESSICGDGNIGIGEDCDDGNNINGDGCSNICLNEGSAGFADCGNGEVEKNEDDAFSWVFKTKSAPNAFCALSSVEVIPANTSAYIGDVVDYRSIGRSSPDSCDPKGQTINPLNYNWGWGSDNILIANLITPLQNIFCNDDPYQKVDALTLGTTNINAIADGITGSGIITVEEPTGPGVPCILGGGNCCQEGVSSCIVGYECIEDGTDCAEGGVNTEYDNCLCCCNMSNDQCLAPLECTPDIESCVGNNRGWCCGCEDDIDCSAPLLCGSDTCCHPRPEVISRMPTIDDVDVCRNVLVSAEFDQKMEERNLKNNFKLYETMGVLSNTDFEDGVIGSVPADWLEYSQIHSFVGISNADSLSGNQSVLIHQDPNQAYKGTCTEIICSEDSDCTWIIGAPNTCSFSNPDNTHPIAPAIYNEGEELFWPNTHRVVYLKLVYNVAPLNWQIGERYILKFYYKGHTDNIVRVSLGYSLGWRSQCNSKSISYVVDLFGNCLPQYGLECANQPTHCCRQAPVQTECYTSLIFPTISAGTTENDWTEYTTNFIYTQEMANLLDNSTPPELHNEIGLYMSYGATGPQGTDLYIDDFQVISVDSIEVKGEVDSYEVGGNTIATFAPDKILEPASVYFVKVFGDLDINDNIVEGVLSEYGIAMDGDDTWSFTTGDVICDIDYIRVDVEVGDSPRPNNIFYEDMRSDIFLCAGKDDCVRDADGVAAGNQHLFHAFAIDDGTGSILNPSDFDWTWTEIDADDIFQLSALLENAALTANPINSKSFLNIEAVSNSAIDYGRAEKKMTINTFMCENPWPDISYWPWEDWIINNSTANCDTNGICRETYFDLFYCRDDGEGGIIGDLPIISMDPIVRSENGEILKEIFFIVGDAEGFGGSSGGPSITNASINPCLGINGTSFIITVDIYDIDGIDGPTATASIQDPDEAEIVSINLIDDGTGTYSGTWISVGCIGECSYFVDINVCDSAGDCSELENILCL